MNAITLPTCWLLGIGTLADIVGVASAGLTVTVFELLQTEVGVDAASTALNEYVVVELGFTSMLEPEPIEVPWQFACENQLKVYEVDDGLFVPCARLSKLFGLELVP